MNLLAKSEVFAENKLFATLDTTVRKVIIENLPFLLSDTVGFIRKLPTDLVDSFKSTLDEVREADLLVHVVDISHPDFEEQIQVVEKTIADLGAGGKPSMIVFNKVDAYTYVEKAEDDLTPKTKENITLEELMHTWMAKLNDNCIFISAREKTNIDQFRELLYKKVKELHVQKYPYNDFYIRHTTKNNDKNMTQHYRLLTREEIARLEAQHCIASDWSGVEVADNFRTDYIHHARFSGKVRLGVFEKEFTLAGGMAKHSGVYYATLHNVTVGDNCYIENVKNYIANYEIGHDTFIENVDIILVDCHSRFGNGVEVSVLNETGGREVIIHDRLSAHQAYIMALYRHRPVLIDKMRKIIESYAESHASDTGTIGSHVMIVNAGYIKNVRIGDYCQIEGTGRLKNGSINSNEHAPVHIGYGVICDDFIISSGSHVEDGTMLTRCFVGQACHLGHTYSASDSLFFSNCQEENGEACAILPDPLP